MGVERLEEVRLEFLSALESAGGDPEAVEQVRIRFVGKRSGLMNELAAALRELPPEERRDYGRALNELKQFTAERLEAAKNEASSSGESTSTVDVTLPGRRPVRAGQHPVHLVRRRIEDIFLRMGYTVETGPEVEDDWHNF